MKHGFVGIRQKLRPPVLTAHCDAVDEGYRAAVAVGRALQMLGGAAHHRTLQRPGAGDRLVHQGAGGNLGNLLTQRAGLRGEQLEQLAEAHDGVKGRQELGKDIASAERAGEHHAVL